MYVSPISTRFVRGRSTPEIRAILVLSPWSFDLSPAAAYVSDWGRSRAPHHGGARSCTCHKSVELTHVLSWVPRSVSNNLAYNPTTMEVDRRQLDFNPVSHQQPDEISVHPIGDVGCDLLASVEPHPIQRFRQLFDDDPR